MKHNLLPDWLQQDLRDASRLPINYYREERINECIEFGILRHPELFREGYKPLALHVTM